MDLSKIESGKYEINPVTYELASLVNDSISTTSVRLEDKPVRLLVRVDPELPACLIGDDVRIRQIMMNFLVNAIKYTGEGFVKLGVRGIPSNGRVLLCVTIRDSGLGIREEDKADLFQVFQTFDSRQNRMIEGTGLGLPLSRKLVEAMGGAVHVESTYGEGSAFTFLLPQEVPENVEPFVNLAIDPEIKVIVCESDRNEMETWSRTLESLHVDYLLVSNFSEFVFLLHSNPRHRYFLDSAFYRRYGDNALAEATQSVTIIADRNEVFGSTMEFRVLRRPVYSLSLAAALANVRIGSPSGNADLESEQFIAPSARILVVDDNAVNLTIFAGLLQPYQCDIEMADNGREAVELLKLNYFDLVFMDHMMPEPDGVETAKIIRNLDGGRVLSRPGGLVNEQVRTGEAYYRNLPIIIATANAISGMREKYLSGDFDDYITKPINVSKLNSTLQRWIPEEKQQLFPIEGRSERQRDSDDPERFSTLDLRFLDAGTGLRFADGSLDGYLKVLKTFGDRAAGSRESVADLFGKGRWKDLTIEVHAVKSLAKGIGAERLSALAAKIESAAKREDESSVAEHIGKFLTIYKQVEKEIKTVLESFRKEESRTRGSSDENEIDRNGVRERLLGVASALDDFDFSEAMARFERISLTCRDEKTLNCFEEIRGLITGFEYEQAGMKIREYLEQSTHPDVS